MGLPCGLPLCPATSVQFLWKSQLSANVGSKRRARASHPTSRDPSSKHDGLGSERDTELEAHPTLSTLSPQVGEPVRLQVALWAWRAAVVLLLKRLLPLGRVEYRHGGGVEWTKDTEILFSSSVCTEEVQEVRRTGSGGAGTWLCPWQQHLGAALLSFPLIPLVPRMLGGTTVEPSQVSQLCLRTSCPHGGEGVPDLCHFHSTQVPKHFVVPLR